MKKKNAILLIALPATVLVVFSIEHWLDALHQTAAQTFAFSPWQFTPGMLIYASLMAGMVWWMAIYSKPHAIVSIIYIFAGGLLAFYRPLSLALNIPLLRMIDGDPVLASGWVIAQTGGFILITGIFSLVKPRKSDELEA